MSKVKNFLYLLPIILLGTFTSCKIGQKYTRPDLHLPTTLGAENEDSLSLADLKWWQLYADTSLQKLIRQALEYNKDIKISSANILALAQQKRISLTNMLPTADLKLYGERETTNYGGDSKDTDYSYEIKGIASWELDLWGNLRWARENSKALLNAEIENERAIKMSIVAEVAQAYFELVALDNELAIVKQTLDAREEGVRLANLRYLGGLTSEIVYKQACVEHAKTATLVPDLERKIALKENQISNLTGAYPHSIERNNIQGKIKSPANIPIGLPSTLIERRPDVRKSEQELIAANASLGVAYTNMFPRLALTAEFGLESDGLKNILSSPYSLLSGKLLSPLLGMGKNIARHRAKKAEYEAAVAKYEKAVLDAFTDTHNAIVDFNKIKEICDLRENLEQTSKSTMELAQLQYINGVIGYLDLLDAQRAYFDAQISLSNAIRDKQIMFVNLYKALGGGW